MLYFAKVKRTKTKSFASLDTFVIAKEVQDSSVKIRHVSKSIFAGAENVFLSPSSSLSHSFAKPKWTTLDTNECLHAIDNNVPCIHICNFLFFSYRVKKPDEFNRPRIPYSQRKIKARSSKFLSKKVNRNIFGAKIQIENLKNYCTKINLFI